MSPHGGKDVLRTAMKISLIFVGIVWVFSIARDGGVMTDDTAVAATDEVVIEAPQGRKRMLSAVAAPGGDPVLRQ